MLAGLFGLVGIVLCFFVADAFDKGSGGRVALYLSVALVCFGISIMGVTDTPAFLVDECDDYSRFASSC